MKRLVVLLGMLIALLMSAIPVSADGIIIPDPPIRPDPMPPVEDDWLTIRYHRVTVTIDHQIATTEVDQVFRNDHDFAVEGTYAFPLPGGAMIDDFTMWVDGEKLDGEMLPADQARSIYEDYVRRQQDPALLEYVGRDTIRARIFPIPPNGERHIRLRYRQVLESDYGLMHYQYPLNTEKFSAKPLELVSVRVEIHNSGELRALYSPSHQDSIMIDRSSPTDAVVSYEASQALPDRDFELYIGTATDPISANLLSHHPADEDGYFLLMVAPALEAPDAQVVARDIVIVLDTSGSMDGEKLQQAKAGLIYILRHLHPEDYVNVVSFSSQVSRYAPGLISARYAAEAEDWVGGLEALGGTNLYLALDEACRQFSGDRPSVVILITDGLPTEGLTEDDELLNALQKSAPDRVSIFPLGVGYDINTLLLDQIAESYRGLPTYIEPGEAIDEKVSAFFQRIQSPLLTDIELSFGDVQVYDVFPSPLPDVFAGEQFIVTGRYRGSGTQTITLTGRIDGERRSFTYKAEFEAGEGESFIAHVWAARKIGHLLTQVRLHGEQQEWIDAIVALSIRYGIMTPYTSFLIEEPGALTVEGREEAAETVREQFAAAPTAVGPAAVDDAKMRQELGSAESVGAGGAYAPAASSSEEGSTVRRVLDKAFICTVTHCTDTLYIPDTMKPIDIAYQSDLYRDHPEWNAYFALAAETIFVAPDGKAYRFTLMGQGTEPSSPDTAMPTATSTPAAPAQANPTPTRRTGPAVCSSPLLLLAGILVWKRCMQ